MIKNNAFWHLLIIIIIIETRVRFASTSARAKDAVYPVRGGISQLAGKLIAIAASPRWFFLRNGVPGVPPRVPDRDRELRAIMRRIDHRG